MSLVSKIMNKLIKTKKVPVPYPINREKLIANKVALVTGGSSGIGYSIAEVFLQHGAVVVIAGRNERKLENALEKLKTVSSSVSYICMDIGNVESLDSIAKRVFTNYGSIDILVNAAGMHYTEPFGKVTDNEFSSIIDINIKGTYFLTQSVCNLMIENKIHGNILNVSSSSGLRPAWGPYQISKWAINGMTKGFADKLIKYGIVVNAVAPGQTATPMLNVDSKNISNSTNLIGRYILPSEIAHIALFLVSDMGRIIVGDTVYASGGSGIVSLHR